jgi:hypothetical protein
MHQTIIPFYQLNPAMKHYKTITGILRVLQIMAFGILALMIARGITYFSSFAR